MDYSRLVADLAAGGNANLTLQNAFFQLQSLAKSNPQNVAPQMPQQAHNHSNKGTTSNQNPSIPSLSSVDNLNALMQAAAGMPLGSIHSTLAALVAPQQHAHPNPAKHHQKQPAHQANNTPLLAPSYQHLQHHKPLHQSSNQLHHNNHTSSPSSSLHAGFNNSSTSLILNNNSKPQVNFSSSSATANSNSVKSSTYYKIGEYVYFETTPEVPLQIGKIDELCKSNGDIIEVKAVCFFRRRDISSSLLNAADKYHYDECQEEEIKGMSEKEKHLLKQRELFYSRQIETLPASSIRGKCSVQLLNESESLASYINKEDTFFYTLVYDPQQKTMLADRGEIRVGNRYQAEVPQSSIYKCQPGGDPADPRDSTELETLLYTPNHELTDDLINKYLTIARAVGTFARALDSSSSIKQPSLHLTAASASRDITLLHAMELLHKNDYDLGKAVCALVPSNGPLLCRDEIEEWTAGEATLFEEAIEKYGREFVGIRQDFIPWKSVKNIVEYYYMWKTTDRSIHQKRLKAYEAENKVKQVCIPNNKKFSSNGSSDGHNLASFGRACESCGMSSSSQWHSWQAQNGHRRVCNECWIFWKKYGGLKFMDQSQDGSTNESKDTAATATSNQKEIAIDLKANNVAEKNESNSTTQKDSINNEPKETTSTSSKENDVLQSKESNPTDSKESGALKNDSTNDLKTSPKSNNIPNACTPDVKPSSLVGTKLLNNENDREGEMDKREVYFFADRQYRIARRYLKKRAVKRLGRRPFELPTWSKA